MNDLIKTTDIKAAEIFVPHGLDPILKEIDQAVSTIVADISTEKGRKEIASVCYKIKRSKTYLDNIGKEYVAELKERPKIVDGERKRMRDYLDDLENKIRQPLTEWEEAEKKRKQDILHRIAAINPFNGITITIDDYGLDEFTAMLDKAQQFKITDDLGEFKGFGENTKTDVILKLEGLIAKKKHYLAEQAELERLRKESEERGRKEREEKLQREAAERARLEAEAKAKIEAEKAERERQAAIAAQESAERRAKETEERAKREIEEATRRERERHEREKREAENAAKKREADKMHYAKINNEIVSGIMLIMSENHSGNQIEAEKIAKAIVTAIAKKQIPHISITY
jgi:hypothetical protein